MTTFFSNKKAKLSKTDKEQLKAGHSFNTNSFFSEHGEERIEASDLHNFRSVKGFYNERGDDCSFRPE